MTIRHKAAALLLTAAVLAGIILPCAVLFPWGGLMDHTFLMETTWWMLLELAVLAGLMLAAARFLPEDRRFLGALAILSGIFLYFHVMVLPVAVSFLFTAGVYLIGRGIRRGLLRLDDAGAPEGDFILGASAVVVLFCGMSLFHLCTEWGTRAAFWGISVLSAVLQREFLRRQYRALAGKFKRVREKSLPAGSLPRWGIILMLLVFLIQTGRMNRWLDFDSLWYGVRSRYILMIDGSVYTNPGMVTMVSVYSKGFEILTLPLCALASHSYMVCVNVWLLLLGAVESYRLALFFADRRTALIAPVFTMALPAITNMSITAKADIITWALQLSLLYLFFRYLREERVLLLLYLGAGYLFSMTLKPTALVFSTAVCGMMGLYLLFSRRLKLRAPVREWLVPVLPGAALIAVWARTWRITGMPVTSIFTSIFARLGFSMRYPFAVSALPQNWQEEALWFTYLRRIFQILILPCGKDMRHVILAWGTPILMLFLLIIGLSWHSIRQGKDDVNSPEADIPAAARKLPLRTTVQAFHVIFWPFFAVNSMSLLMLYQIDGNYFLLLYSMLILWTIYAIGRVKDEELLKLFRLALAPMLVFCLFMTSLTNWIMGTGFNEADPINKGRMNHWAMEHYAAIVRGNTNIWEMLAKDQTNRVIAFGYMPYCLQFPCNVQGYLDVTSPWGNVDLVMTTEAFSEYMEWAETDYLYAEAGYFCPDNEWSYWLMRELIREGRVDDLYIENGNCLMRPAKEPVTPGKAAENLELFDGGVYVNFPPSGA
ncbi:MAG: potassium transporter KefB [Clostridium sp.]|nr:potassium transporter KefB [Clostridium sp.]